MNSATTVERSEALSVVAADGRAEPGQSPTPPANPQPPREATIYYVQPSCDELSWRETVYGLSFVAGWIAFFAFGLFVPTKALRDALGSGDLTILESVGAGIVVVSGYTLTNVLFLVCLASLIGCMTHRWQVASKLDVVRSGDKDPFHRIYFAAVLRGFFIYLLFVAGFLTVTTSASIENTTLDQYIRIAGTMSIIGFILGFDPNLLIGLIRRALNFADPKYAEESEGRSGGGGSGPSPGSAIEDYVLRMDPESFEALRERHANAHRAPETRTNVGAGFPASLPGPGDLLTTSTSLEPLP